MEKENVTTDLVSLRSGLSLISKYTDEIRKEEQNRSKSIEKIDQIRAKKEEAQNKIAALQKELEDAKKNYEETKYAYEGFDDKVLSSKDNDETSIKQTVDATKPQPKKFAFDPDSCNFNPMIFRGFYKEFLDKSLLWIKVAISVYIAGVVILLFGGAGSSFMPIIIYVIWGLTALPLAFAILLPVIWGLLYLIKGFANYIFCPTIDIIKVLFYNTFEFPKEKRLFKAQYNTFVENERNALLKKRQGQKNALKQKLDSAKKASEKCEKMLKSVTVQNRNFDMDIRVLNAEIQLIEHEIEKQAKKSQNLANALEDTYGITLSPTDWSHLDIILHFLMTGRADTLKEALQQLDRQKQTDQIVGAIKSAEEAIGSHIRTAISGLGQALAISFERIDDRLKALSMDMVSVGESMNKKLDFQNQRLDSQISLQEMNAALLEKSNATSETLLNDLRYNQRFWIK